MLNQLLNEVFGLIINDLSILLQSIIYYLNGKNKKKQNEYKVSAVTIAT